MIRPLVATALLLITALPLSSASAVTSEVDRIVAVVDQDVISASELDARLHSIKVQAPESAQLPSDKVLRQQLLEQMITERIQLARAKKLGISISDERLSEIISGIAKQNQLDLVAFRDTLSAAGIDFAAFREEMRTEVVIKQLRQKEVVDKVEISAQDIEAFIATQTALLNEGVEYRLGHILIPIKGANDSASVNEAHERAKQLLEALQSAPESFSEHITEKSFQGEPIQASDLDWRRLEALPTLFVDVVPGMKVGSISDLLRSPSGFHIVKLIDKRGEDKHMVQQNHARHILIATNEVTNDEQARKNLKELRERISNGADFAELARAHSDDPGSAALGGDLGWAGPGHFVPAFEEAISKLQPGNISQPFKSQFGWHIVQLLEVREFDDTEAFRRNQIRELLTQRKVETQLESWLRQLRDVAYVDIRLQP